MFLIKSELKTDLYQYQLDQITENDAAIVEEGIATGIEEVRAYLTPNNQITWLDGRLRYDVTAIFNATGSARNPLILAHTKDIAVWHILQLNNTDVIWEQAKERYDRAVKFLTKLQKGEVNLGTLPLMVEAEAENGVEKLPFQMGSSAKFNHE